MQVKTSWKYSISLSNFILNYMRFWRIISSFSRKVFQTYEIINGKMIKLLVCFFKLYKKRKHRHHTESLYHVIHAGKHFINDRKYGIIPYFLLKKLLFPSAP